MTREPTSKPENEELGDKLRVALELYEIGVALQRERLTRENPTLTPSQIEALVSGWLTGAPADDHGGVIVDWPRK